MLLILFYCLINSKYVFAAVTTVMRCVCSQCNSSHAYVCVCVCVCVRVRVSVSVCKCARVANEKATS